MIKFLTLVSNNFFENGAEKFHIIKVLKKAWTKRVDILVTKHLVYLTS